MAETEMVERVAQACRDVVALDRGRSVSFEEMSRLVARAAIDALREPTDEVNDALDRVPGGFGRGAWLEGIDAALSDTSTKG